MVLLVYLEAMAMCIGQISEGWDNIDRVPRNDYHFVGFERR